MVRGRVAVVVGGSRGIGAAAARHLDGLGARVAVLSRSPAAGAGIATFQCDVTEQASVHEAFDRVDHALGAPDIVVVCAGVTADGLLMAAADDAVRRVMDVNLTGAFRVARRAAPAMVARGWGRLIFISSVAGLSGSAGQSAYAASKSGLVGLARSLAREMGTHAVTANVVAPGFVETSLTADVPRHIREQILATTPAGRFGTTEEVAAAIAFLATDSAAYITGAVLPVDGGQGIGW